MRLQHWGGVYNIAFAAGVLLNNNAAKDLSLASDLSSVRSQQSTEHHWAQIGDGTAPSAVERKLLSQGTETKQASMAVVLKVSRGPAKAVIRDSGSTKKYHTPFDSHHILRSLTTQSSCPFLSKRLRHIE